MPRNKAQKAARNTARRFRRQMLPRFPLSKLPLELQLLVLCKCDLKSLRILIRLSPDLQSLYFAYPEACLRGSVLQYPHPVSSLVQTFWTLYNIDTGFDLEKATALLHQCTDSDYPVSLPVFPVTGVDPIEALDSLLGLCEDVDNIVQIYAQSSAAAIETVVNPGVEVAPIALSTTEFARISSACWMLRVFYQLQVTFIHHPQISEYMTRYLGHLHPWQVEQGLSFEALMGSRGFTASSTVYTLIGNTDNKRSELCKTSSLFRSYLEVSSIPAHLRSPNAWFPTIFARVVNSEMRRHTATSGGRAPWTKRGFPVELQVGPSEATGRLRNDGWIYYKLVRHAHTITPRQYLQFFVDLGIFFWDLNRLVKWDIVDPDEFLTVHGMLQDQLRKLARRRYGTCCGGCCVLGNY